MIERNLEDDIHVLANGELLEWVFENVLKNGVESIEAQNGLITVTMSKLAKGKVIITLKDNGKGMPGQIRRRIFEPGFTTKKRGWGLGLSLSKRIVERYHDGKIFVKDSTVGKGTTFVIELPVIA